MFYVYALLDPRKPGIYKYSCTDMVFSYEPFYVGKGSGNRDTFHLYPSDVKKNSNEIKCSKILKIWEAGLQVAVVRIQEFESEIEALRLERIIVEGIGTILNRSGPLTNIAPGGGGQGSGEFHPNKGVKWSEEVRRKMSETTKNNLRPEDLANLLHAASQPKSEEVRKKISEKLRGRPRSKEHIEKLKATKAAKIWTEEELIRYTEAHSKLTDKDARDILLLVISGEKTRKECTEKYKVSRSAIDRLFTPKSWKHLTPYREELIKEYRGATYD